MKCDRDVSERISEVHGGVDLVYRTLVCAGAALEHCDDDSDEKASACLVVLDQVEALDKICGLLNQLNTDLALHTAYELGKSKRQEQNDKAGTRRGNVIELKPQT
jgi:hypothetical protein